MHHNSDSPRPHDCAVVTIDFCRGSSIKPGEARNPWHWAVLIQLGHVFHISPSFAALPEAIADFSAHGPQLVAEIEDRLSRMYAAPDKAPYCLDAFNAAEGKK